MTSRKQKQLNNPNSVQVLRTRSGGKKKPDLFARLREEQHPLDEILDQNLPGIAITKDEDGPLLSLAEQGQPVIPAQQGQHGQPAAHAPVAPVRNFQKVTNSITQQAIPQGLFRQGKSKQIYDVLYALTRGAIKPTRTIQISKPRLREKSGVNTRATLDGGLAHLQLVGLIRIKEVTGGQHSGHEYEVLLPEEINPADHAPHGRQAQHADPLEQTQDPLHPQKLTMLSRAGANHAEQGLDTVNAESSVSSKTILKTKRENDDEAQQRFAPLAGLRETFDEVFTELTGKGIELNDSAALQEIAELLAAELRAARQNTKSISKPAAFLVQHLKSRLAAPVRLPKAAPVKPDTIGKPADQQSEAPQPIDLSIYTAEELIEFEKEFCLSCGNRYDECNCTTPQPA